MIQERIIIIHIIDTEQQKTKTIYTRYKTNN